MLNLPKKKTKTTKKVGYQENTTKVVDFISQPEVANVLTEEPVQSTTRTAVVEAPVLARQPVQPSQQPPTSTKVGELVNTRSRLEGTTKETIGCKSASEAHAKADGARDTMDPTNTDEDILLHKVVCTAILEKLELETEDTTTTTIQYNSERDPVHGVKRKGFITAEQVTPSIAVSMSTTTETISTCSQPASRSSGGYAGTLTGLSAGCLPNDEDQNTAGCELKRGGWCNTHNLQARKSWKFVKTWTKKSSGLCGYTTKRRVQYTCEAEPKSGSGVKSEQPGTSVRLNKGGEVGRLFSVGDLGLVEQASKKCRRV